MPRRSFIAAGAELLRMLGAKIDFERQTLTLGPPG